MGIVPSYSGLWVGGGVFIMRMYDIIEKKRDGFELTDEEIRFFIEGYTDGSIPDYQASALCMAIFFQGMNDREITTLTMAMEKSGDTIDLSDFGTLSADKHSTGGVGDKTSLIVMPTVASLGAKVAKMTGRGLGHTGGTVDKLESIPGYQIALDSNAFLKQASSIPTAACSRCTSRPMTRLRALHAAVPSSSRAIIL